VPAFQWLRKSTRCRSRFSEIVSNSWMVPFHSIAVIRYLSSVKRHPAPNPTKNFTAVQNSVSWTGEATVLLVNLG
jgi:hypothetical protein